MSFRWAVLASLVLLSPADSQASCELAVVGAGAGGAYFSWFAAEAGKQVCIFELGGRPGGRIHSLRKQGPRGDLVVEAGAYRFAPHEVCEPVGPNATWCIHTPITAAAVKKLGLLPGIYDPDPRFWDHKMRKLVNEHGHNVGYLTLVETMLEKATAKGATVHFNEEVVALNKSRSGVELLLKSGKRIEAEAILLNIPQKPLLKILRHSGSPFSTSFSVPLYDPVSFPIMKLYVHYEDAWWRNYLNLTAGMFANKNPSGSESTVISMHDVPDQSPAPLMGQYHDGDVRCDGPGGKCRGFIQAFYSAGVALDFYKNYHPLDGEAAAYLSPSSIEHKQLLSAVHEALVHHHRKALDKVNATKYVERLMPDSGVLSIWSSEVSGIHGGCHAPKNGKHPKPRDLWKDAVQPFKGMPVFVANEAYGPVQCFAEASLNMSSLALDALGIPRLEEMIPEGPRRGLPNPPTDPFLMSRPRQTRSDDRNILV